MWDQIFKRWIDLFFWWLPRQEKSEEGVGGPATRQRPEPAPGQAAEPQPVAAKETDPNDLTVIKGIGPAVREKLRVLGIANLEDLAVADPDSLFEQLKASVPVSKARVQGWTEAARERIELRNRST